MAEEQDDSQDRTEEATPERREEFRERGQVAVSKEVTSVFVLAAIVITLTFYLPALIESLEKILVGHFANLSRADMTERAFLTYTRNLWMEWLAMILPLFAASAGIASFITLFQTRFNWSWKKLQPDFSRMNPLKGIPRMVNLQAVMELGKGIGKMLSVALVSYLILHSEWPGVSGLMRYPIINTWAYWADITMELFWAVAGLLLLIGGVDYIYNFSQVEKKLKMTKQEVKEEFKKREVDPNVKAKIKRMQRDIAMAKMVKDTQTATVMITNPQHFAVALKYELGMKAPVVVAQVKAVLRYYRDQKLPWPSKQRARLPGAGSAEIQRFLCKTYHKPGVRNGSSPAVSGGCHNH